MTGMDEENVNAAILGLRGIRRSMNPAELRVLDYVVEHPDTVVYGTLSKLASNSGASDATVVRFCRSAGYESFNELKIDLAQPTTKKVRRIQRDLTTADTPAVILEKVFYANILSLQESLQTIDCVAFEKAVEAISSAPKIAFMGVGTSGTVALDAVQKFLVAGISVLSYTDIVLQAHFAATCAPEDVVIGLSQSGSTTAIVSSLRTASSRGAKVIAITSNDKSPITKVADINILVSVTELSFQSASNQIRTAQLSVVDALCVGIALRAPEQFLVNNARAEAASHTLQLKNTRR